MNRRQRQLSFLAALLLTTTSEATAATDLKAPYAVESTQVLPKGVANPRFLTLFLSPDTRYDDEGGTQPLGFRLSKTVRWSDVIARQTDDVDKKLIQSVLNDLGFATSSSPGATTGTVAAHIDVRAPILAFGITERLTAAVVVPIVRADVKVDTGFVQSPMGQAFIDRLCTTSPEKCNDAATKLNNATQEKLASLNYKPAASKTVSGLGDIQLMGKYRLFGDATHALAIRLMTALPTGTPSSADDVIDVTTGDLRFKAGAMVIYERVLHAYSRWNFYGGYTLLFPNRIKRRLPSSGDDPLSADEVSLTRRESEQVSLGTSIDYRVTEIGVTFTAAYSLQYQGKTRYRAEGQPVATSERLRWLEDLEPAQSLHSMTLAASFSTVDWYQRGAFFLPFQLNALYSRPIAGRNAPTAGIFAAELVAFF